MKILNHIQFNTGRQYTVDGQDINAWLVQTENHGEVIYFMDRSRLVDGMYVTGDVVSLTQHIVMNIYDHNLHDSGSTNDAGERLYSYEIQNALVELGQDPMIVKGWGSPQN